MDEKILRDVAEALIKRCGKDAWTVAATAAAAARSRGLDEKIVQGWLRLAEMIAGEPPPRPARGSRSRRRNG